VVSSDLHCGDCGSTNVVDGGKSSRRSLPQLKRYHAMIRAAFHQWPEAHLSEHGIGSEDDLRKHLQMRVGHKEIAVVIDDIGSMSKAVAMTVATAAFKAAGAYSMPVMHGDKLVIFVPKSVAFHKMAHTDFCKLSDDVEAIIEAEIGVKADQLLREKAA
jgi:hypothetical protein